MLERGETMNVPITLANGNTVDLNNITESGNGYIRFSDGTQICYGFYTPWIEKDQTSNRASASFNYAKPFCNLPVCNVSRQLGISEDSNLALISENYRIDRIISNYVHCTYDMVHTNSNFFEYGNYNVSYIAIGRWK